jgi:endonuclease-3 related protein
MIRRKNLSQIYEILLKEFGPQNWWPADSLFEVIAGAVLTQNTNWTNVSRAIANLKKEELLAPQRIASVDKRKLITAIRPSGFYNQKASYLKGISRYIIERYSGDLGKMSRAETGILRDELLAIKGLGPETADSILLYALDKPVFVIDSYTRRIFSRHGVEIKDADYAAWQECFESNLPRDAVMFNEYHALIVRLAKERCRKKPDCRDCPLEGITIANPFPRSGPPVRGRGRKGAGADIIHEID